MLNRLQIKKLRLCFLKILKALTDWADGVTLRSYPHIVSFADYSDEDGSVALSIQAII